MKVISFDVGIRNLAFCYFEIPDKKIKDYKELIKQIRIIKWDIINLSNDDKDLVCNQKNKNGKSCKSKGIFKFKSSHILCKKHAKNSNFIIPSKETNITYLKSKKKDDIIKTYKTLCGIDVINFSNKPNETKQYYLERIKECLNNKILEPTLEKKIKDISLIDVGIQIKKQLDSLFVQNIKNDIDVDLVLIENQISPIANRMKTVQGLITQYFIMRDVNNIVYLSSNNKLKLFIDKKTTYKERKNIGIEIMNNQILEYLENGKWTDIFNSHKKKDDLADSFLQSIYYLVK
tara:strand:- start:574 stop:1443 length:870 start_codon:yes stop_codon:yes gene_type:complete